MRVTHQSLLTKKFSGDAKHTCSVLTFCEFPKKQQGLIFLFTPAQTETLRNEVLPK